MNSKKFKFNRTLFIFIIIIQCFTFNCKTPQPMPEPVSKDAENLQDNLQNNLLDKIKKTYPLYTEMSVNFDISGKIDKNELVYFGTMYAKINAVDVNQSYLSIKIKDTVFMADFYSLEIKNGFVIQTNYLTDEIIKTSLINYKWVEIFGNTIPFHFYFPLLLGLPPSQIFGKDAVINEEAEKILYRSDIYDTMVEFSGGFIKKIYFRTKSKKDVLSLSFS